MSPTSLQRLLILCVLACAACSGDQVPSVAGIWRMDTHTYGLERRGGIQWVGHGHADEARVVPRPAVILMQELDLQPSGAYELLEVQELARGVPIIERSTGRWRVEGARVILTTDVRLRQGDPSARLLLKLEIGDSGVLTMRSHAGAQVSYYRLDSCR